MTAFARPIADEMVLGEPPLRSLLFAPANEPRKLARLGTFGADAVAIDLEDAVPDAQKDESREVARAHLGGLGRTVVCVRVNGMRSCRTEGDVLAIVAPGLDAVILPKAESRGEIEGLDRMLVAAERAASLPEGRIGIIPLVETAAGVAAALDVCGAPPRVLTVAFGSGDFTTDLGLPRLRWSSGAAELAFARGKLIVDAKAAGRRPPLDGPYLDVRDADGFEHDCRAASTLGYRGKVCIHPSQVPVANLVFSPEPDEVAFCRRVVELFTREPASGRAAITVDGMFVDYPIAAKARRIVALAEALGRRDAALGVEEP